MCRVGFFHAVLKIAFFFFKKKAAFGGFLGGGLFGTTPSFNKQKKTQPTHLRKISAELGIHPFLVKKHIDTLTAKQIIVQQPAGKTILLTINTLIDGIENLLYVIEDCKQKS